MTTNWKQMLRDMLSLRTNEQIVEDIERLSVKAYLFVPRSEARTFRRCDLHMEASEALH